MFGEKYKDLTKTVTINILNYNFLPENNYHMVGQLYYNEDKERSITDKLEIHFIDLPKFRNTIKSIDNELTAWLAFIDRSRGELVDVAADRVRQIEKAEELLQKLKQDRESWEIYELQQKKLHDDASNRYTGYVDGLEVGMKKGKLEEKKEMAKKLIDEKLDLETISRITGLPVTELKKL